MTSSWRLACLVVGLLPCEGLVVPHALSRCSACRRAVVVATAGEELSASDREFLAYWKAHGGKWKTPLRLLDVSTAYELGDLDGILPSGAPSRVKSSERMLTLGRAVELFEKGELQVRKRFRSMTPVDMAPRWDRVMATRARLRAAGTWADIVTDSDRARAYQRARVRGEVEDADASPAVSRVVATVLSPALKAAAAQRSRADGGLSLALAELLETAGDTPAERWLTAVLLAELESEVAELVEAARRAEEEEENGLGAGSRRRKAAPSFAEVEAQRDVEQANQLGLVGVAAAVGIGLTLLSMAGGGGDDDALQRTLDLMQ
jgi:hypothetical protein